MAFAAAIVLALPASAAATFTPLGTWSTTFTSPDAIAIVPTATGAAQDVWITEDTGDTPGEDAEELTPTGTLVRAIAPTFVCQGTNETFDFPNGIAVDPVTGDVFVDDSGDDRIIEFNSSGTFIAQIGGGEVSTTCGTPASPDTAGSGPGSFDSPTGLSVGGGQLFVASPGPDCGSSGNEFVDELPVPLSESHLRTGEFGTDGAYGQALYDPATTDVYAADSAPNSIDVYNSSGTYLTTWPSVFNGGNFAACSPQWIAIDPAAGVLYAVDTGNDAVDSFNLTTGAYLQTLSGLTGPQGIAIDPVNHVLYIVEDGSADTVARYSYTPAPTCKQSSSVASTSTSITPALSCTDEAGAPVSYALASNPAHGTLNALNPATGAVTYTPNAGYNGPDSFSYTGSSVNGTSQPSTVSIDVSAPPACAEETLSTSAASPLGVTLACSGSASAAAASYRILSGPGHGSLSTPTSDGALTYSPLAGFSGSDSFTYEGVSPDGVASAPQTVTIYVGEGLPPPVEGDSANVVHSSGSVFITLPGQTQPIPLVAGMQVPLGSVIDTTDGRVEVFVTNQLGEQHAVFYSGQFELTQSASSHSRRLTATGANRLLNLLGPGIPEAAEASAPTVYAVLDLVGPAIPKARCTSYTHSVTGRFSLRLPVSGRRALRADIAKAFHDKGKPVRQLWGNGHGDFTTVGNGSSSSVRGTKWAIFDYPDGTLTRVYSDSVSVYDFHTHRSVTVVAGHYYFAALGNLKRCS